VPRSPASSMNIRRTILSPYHYLWAAGSALIWRYPARSLKVIAVTGTKGKSSVAEMLYAILTAAGHKTALAGTIRFAIGEDSQPNLYKMTLPGRGFIQKFLAEAVAAGCTHAVIEITSEAALQHRHLFLDLDALIFTNLEPEHIESHGGMERYFAAKFEIGRALARSPKRPRAIIANEDSAYGERFLALPVESKLPYSIKDAEGAEITDSGVAFTYLGMRYSLPQPGAFSVMNALAAIRTALWLGEEPLEIKSALMGVRKIPGRAERVEAGQDYAVVVDYAHTPGSLTALYEAFKDKRKICVLGNTGGGRDTWKRPLMGSIAEQYCDEIILTNEDPYDEKPEKIVAEMAAGIKNKKPMTIMDRREAIRAALRAARPGDTVLITGKGTDPFIMGPKGSKTEWSDSRVAREELEKLAK
jgi:UDP-N-acetylmuramoyl-L-alanyl-D-glutamate--2,6-diaminopimelate ligase